MKILHIINYFQPKLGYQENFLPKAYIKMGHDVAIVTSDRYRPFPNFKESYGELLGERRCGSGFGIEEGAPVYRLPVLFESRYRVWLLGLEKLVLKLKPDLVISNAVGFNSFRLARLKLRGCKFKLIVDDHMINLVLVKGFGAEVFYNLRKKMIKKILIPAVDKFVGACWESCEILRKVNGVPAEKIEYIPLGADTTLFKFDEKERKGIRGQLGITDNDVLLLYTGKIHQCKGVDTLVRAFDVLTSKRKVYLLLIGGADKEFKKELMNLVGEEKKKNIIFHPFLPNSELPKYYSASDICIWPRESSMGMIDAMSCGRAVIGSNIPVVEERLVNNNGLMFKAGDYKDLAVKIKYLAENDELREKMGKRGRELVEKKFSWDKIAEDFIRCAGD